MQTDRWRPSWRPSWLSDGGHLVGHLGYRSSDKPIFEIGREFDGNHRYIKFGRHRVINDHNSGWTDGHTDRRTDKPKIIELHQHSLAGP